MNIRKLFVTAATFSLLLMSSCMYGGGSAGTGINGYGNSSDDLNLTKYNLKAVVTDGANKPIAGLKIAISSSSMNEAITTTDVKGNFSINIKSASGDPLIFNFTKGAINTSCESYISPAGEDSVNVKLKILNSKKAVCP